jgi:hypothetical protein
VGSADIDIVTASPEADVFSVNADLTWAGAVTAAEGYIALEVGLSRWRAPGLLAASDGDIELFLFALDFASSAASSIAPSKGDVVYFPLPYAGRWGWGTTANRNTIVVVEAATTAAGCCSGKRVFIPVSSTQDHGPSSRAVVAEEVGGTAARVAATAQFHVELLIVAVAAVAVAVEVALALLIQLGGRVAARHGAGRLWVRGASARLVG